MFKKRVSYWRMATGLRDLIEGHGEAINALLDGTYVASDLEKLRGHEKIYSYRLSGAGRLLLTTIEYQGQPCLHVLEHLPNHEYDKSRFLKSGVLKRYLAKQVDADNGSPYVFEAMVLGSSLFDAKEPSEDATFPAVPLDTFDREWIELSPAQLKAVSSMEGGLDGQSSIALPAVFTGPAGSGKTSTAFLLLEAYVKQLNAQPCLVDEEPKRLLYLTRSPLLAVKISELWEQSAYSGGLGDSINVNVMSYDDFLVACLKPTEPLIDKQIVGLDFFEIFLKGYQDRKGSKYDTETLYQNIRLYSGYSTQEEYLHAGQRYTDEIDRSFIYALCIAYREFLEAQHVCDPAVQVLPNDSIYDFLIVDEAQDLSTRQLHNALKVTKNIVFFMDGNQSLFDKQSKLPYLKHLFHQYDKKAQFYQFDGSYRCPKHIAAVANALLQAKYEITGGAADELESTSIHALQGDSQQTGDVCFILPDDMEKEEHVWLLTKEHGTNVAVVTLPEFVEKAKVRFQTPLVFTPEQMKGLQYPWVIAYELLPSDKPFLKACLTLSPAPIMREKIHMPKQDRGDFELATQFASIYVGFSRAMERLIIIQTPCYHHAALLTRLQNAVEKPGRGAMPFSTQITPNDWLNEAIKLHSVGAHEQAQAIYNKLTDDKKEEFHALISPQLAKEDGVSMGAAAADEPSLTEALSTGGCASKKNKRKKKKGGQISPPVVLKSPFENLLDAFTLEHLSTFLSVEKTTPLYKLSSKTGKLINKPLQKKGPLVLSLFEYILSDIEKTRVYLDYLKSNSLLLNSPVTKEYIEVLDELVCNNKGSLSCQLAFLHYLFITFCEEFLLHSGKDAYINKSIFNVYFNILSAYEKSAADIFGIEHPICWLIEPLSGCKYAHFKEATPLFVITNTKEGQQFLLLVYKNFPACFLSIPAAAVGFALPVAAGVFENYSPLFQLAGSINGRQLLNNLYLKNPEYLLGIPAEAWGRALPVTAGEYANNSPLFQLAGSTSGRQLLNNLYLKKPEYFLGIPAKAWGLALPAAAGEDENKSPLYYLAAYPEDHQLLSKLYQSHPEYFLGIPAKAWGLALPVLAGDSANTSALYYLAANPEGRQLLNNLYQSHPDYFLSIPAEAWELALPVGAGESANQSPLYFLAANPEGRQLLSKLYQSHTEYFLGIPAKAWGLAMPAAASANKSPLYYLAANPEGRQLLSKLYQSHPDYFLGIPAKAWGLALPVSAGESANTSALYYLVANPEGRQLLNMLYQSHPEYILSIPADAWGIALTVRAGMFENVSPLYYLAGNPEGRQLLNTLYQSHPEYILSIPAEAWGLALTVRVGGSANVSPLYHLAVTPLGRQLLNNLYQSHPDYFLRIPAQAWGLARLAAAGKYENESPLFFLAGNLNGRQLLNNLYQRDPDYFLRIPAEAWGIALPASAGGGANISPLFCLAATSDGRQLLNKLYQRHPDYFLSIPAEAWWLVSPAGRGVWANKSPLYFLAVTPAGRQLLNNLYQKNPDRVLSIPLEAWEIGDAESSTLLWNLTKSPECLALFDHLYESLSKTTLERFNRKPLLHFDLMMREIKNVGFFRANPRGVCGEPGVHERWLMCDL